MASKHVKKTAKCTENLAGATTVRNLNATILETDRK